MPIRQLLTPALLCMAMAPTLGHSQPLPPASRTVFKCQTAGKTVYSDAPCLGAQQIDVEPTRGLNQSSGRVQMGADVRNEQNQEAFAGAVRPITGLDAKQLAVQRRRTQLSVEAQKACRRLDVDLPATQQEEKNATPSDLKEVQLRLFQLRRQSQGLGC